MSVKQVWFCLDEKMAGVFLVFELLPWPLPEPQWSYSVM